MKIRGLILVTFFMISCSSFQFENKSEINREGIRQTFIHNSNDIHSCYKQHGEEKNISGKLIFDFEVDDQGHVLNAKASNDKSTIRDLDLGECIGAKMKAWVFPKSASTETTRVFYPIYFDAKEKTSKQ